MTICAVGENSILISQWKPKYNLFCFISVVLLDHSQQETLQ